MTTEARIYFCIRASRNLYGYAHGPFIFSEERKCFVYKNRAFTPEQWSAEGEALIQRFHKYRPSVAVDLVQVEAPVVVAVAAPTVVLNGEPVEAVTVPPVVVAEDAEHSPAPALADESPTESAAPVKRAPGRPRKVLSDTAPSE